MPKGSKVMISIMCSVVVFWVGCEKVDLIISQRVRVLCFAGDRDRYSLPPDMPTLHAEFTYFYYPGDFVFPREFGLDFGEF